MPTRTDIVSALAKEARITAHLATRLQPQHLGYRFTPGQRSTQELLEYLVVHVELGLRFLLTGSREGAEARRAAVKGIALADIPGALQAQQQAVEALLAPLSEADVATRRVKTAQGVETGLADALWEGVVKQAIGYKTQLFLQAKAAGLAQLGSADLWRGEEARAQAAR